MRTVGKYILVTKQELMELKAESFDLGLRQNHFKHDICTTKCRTKACVNARPKPIKVKMIEDVKA